jgi:hypothetical protein
MSALVDVRPYGSNTRRVFFDQTLIGELVAPDTDKPNRFLVYFVAPTGQTFPFPAQTRVIDALVDLLGAAAQYRYDAHPVRLTSLVDTDDAGIHIVDCPTCQQNGGLGSWTYRSGDEAREKASRDHQATTGHAARIVDVAEPLVF